MPYEIRRETCLGGEFLDKVSNAELSESEEAIAFHDATRHLARRDFEALMAKSRHSIKSMDS